MRFDKAFPAKLFSLVFQAAVILLFFSACSGDPTAPNRPLSLDAAIGTDPTTGATVETDKDDYFPGDQVQITGSGWAPGETVDFHLTREPKTSDDTEWTVTADEDGRFATGFLVVETDLGVTFTLTGTGPTSGSVVTVVFTDNIPPGQISVTLDGDAAVTVAPGATIELVVTARVSTAGNPTAWNSTGWVLTLSTTTPTGKLTHCVDTDNAPGTASSGTEYVRTLNITAPLNPGTYHLWVALDQDDGTGVDACGGLGGQSVKKIFESVVTVEEPENEAPTADAGAYPDGGDEGTSIELDGSGSSDGEGGIASYQWSIVSFDNPDGGVCEFDGGVSTGVSPSITCDDNGTLTVSLVVTDEDDLSSAADQATIVVSNVDPTVVISPDTRTINEGGSASYTATITDPGSNDTHTVFSWTSTIGACTPDAGATNTAATFTCTDNGTGTVKLEVTDDDGGTGDDTAALIVNNVEPTVVISPDSRTIDEGSSASYTATVTDPGSSDTHTFAWTTTVGTCTLDAGATKTAATFSCTDDGSGTVKLVVTDDDGDSGEDTAGLTVENVPPTVVISPDPKIIDEGGSASFTATITDPGNDPVATFVWTTTVASCTLDAGATATAATFSCTDDGTGTVKLVATDGDGGTGEDTATLTVNNVAPNITTVTLPPYPIAAGTPVNVSWNFTGAGTDTFTCDISWDTGLAFEPTPAAPSSGMTCSASKVLPAGIYSVTVRVTDDDNSSDTESPVTYIVVYDPSAGFVTGGGWINSPEGALVADPYLTGKANFGFVSKYQKGATTPSGNTEFQFHAGDLNFKSSSYEWLVVMGGGRAQYKGKGTINGAGDYGFLLTAIDGATDKFRIKIWNRATSAVVYDNQMNQLEDSPAATAISGGSIVIHAK